MKLFKRITHTTTPSGRVVETVEKIIETDTNVDTDYVLDEIGRDLQTIGWAIFWAFEETSLKAERDGEIRYIKVEPFK